MIKTVASDFQNILKSKNLKNVFENIKFIHIEVIAFISILFYLISPFSQIVNSIMEYINYGFPAIYYNTVKQANVISGVLGTFSIILYIGKNIVTGYKFKDFIKNNIPMVFFSAFIFLMLISTCINGFTDSALHGEAFKYESIFNYTQYFCIYFFCTSLIDSQKLKAIIEYIFIICSMILGIASIIHINITPVQQYININDFEMLMSVFRNSNHYGYYLAMTVALSGSLLVFEKNKILKALCFVNYIINIYVLSRNGTFGAFIAVLFGLIFLITVLYICNKKININAVMILILFIIESAISSERFQNDILVLFGDLHNIMLDNEDADKAGSSRWKLWRFTCKYIAERPFCGFGVDGISSRLLVDCGEYRTHNEFLQYTAFFGIPAGIMYVCGMFSVFMKGLKHKKELNDYTIASLVTAFTYLVSSFFGVSFFYTAPFLFIFLGLGFAPPKHN